MLIAAGCRLTVQHTALLTLLPETCGLPGFLLPGPSVGSQGQDSLIMWHLQQFALEAAHCCHCRVRMATGMALALLLPVQTQEVSRSRN